MTQEDTLSDLLRESRLARLCVYLTTLFFAGLTAANAAGLTQSPISMQTYIFTGAFGAVFLVLVAVSIIAFRSGRTGPKPTPQPTTATAPRAPESPQAREGFRPTTSRPTRTTLPSITEESKDDFQAVNPLRQADEA